MCGEYCEMSGHAVTGFAADKEGRNPSLSNAIAIFPKSIDGLAVE